jgi:hypothetical protein
MRQADAAFAPADLRFTSATTGDAITPNDCMPNDRRLWYRNHWFSSTPAYFVTKSDSNNNGVLDEAQPVPSMMEARSGTQNPARNFSYGASADYWQLGTGWWMFHLHGDYSDIASTNPTLAQQPVTDPSERRFRSWRSETMAYLHSNLGMGGVAWYTWPGNPTILLNPNTNLTTANIGTDQMRANYGEIPGQGLHDLAVSTSANQGQWERSYFFTMPGAIESQVGNSYPDRRWERPMAMDFGFAINARNNGATDTILGTIFSTKMRPTNEAGSSWSDRPIRDAFHEPFRILAVEAGTSNNAGVGSSLSSEALRRFTTDTMLVPRSLSDMSDYDPRELPPGVPILSITSFKAITRGRNQNIAVVRIQDPETGSTIELGCPIIATTWRGARQHWGWKTKYDNPSLPTTGDYYE